LAATSVQQLKWRQSKKPARFPELEWMSQEMPGFKGNHVTKRTLSSLIYVWLLPRFAKAFSPMLSFKAGGTLPVLDWLNSFLDL
jgi:hypothetical protein